MDINKPNLIFALIFALALSLLMCGCEKQNSQLVYSPVEVESESSTPCPETLPFPTASAVNIQKEEVFGELFPLDNIGVAITDPDTHYFYYYISFSSIRVYEEDGHCYLDGICLNGYDQSLSGKCRVVFYDSEGIICGDGIMHTADSNSKMLLAVGENLVYAEIASENDISAFRFEFLADEPFRPN